MLLTSQLFELPEKLPLGHEPSAALTPRSFSNPSSHLPDQFISIISLNLIFQRRPESVVMHHASTVCTRVRDTVLLHPSLESSAK